MDPTRSLNGGKTRPLSPHAQLVLLDIAYQPKPRVQVNPGLVDRLTRMPDPLCVVVDLPSPFRTHRGKTCPHLQITEAGRAVLRGTTL